VQNIRPFKTVMPTIGKDVYIDPQASVIGQVTIKDNSSVWPMSVIRGDVEAIHIGHSTNVQDGSVLHVTHDGPYSNGSRNLVIGNEVTIGHKVLLHACTIGNQCLIGMGSIVMDNVVIQDRVLLAAGSLVPPSKTLQSGYLYKGNPAKKIRELTQDELEMLAYSASHYVKVKNAYLENN